MKSFRHGATGLTLAALTTCLTIVSCKTPSSDSGIKEAPAGDNSLHWWGLSPIKYDALPMQKTLPKIPWPGDYWATFRGGISYRWQTPNNSVEYKDHIYAIPTAQQVAAMSADQIDKLSPSEKYDLWLGRTDWTTKKSATGYQRDFMLAAAKFNNNKEIPTWTGICNGWSLAAMYEDMPMKPVTVKNAAGVEITFYPGDIKALMSQIYFDYQPQINVARLGALCSEAKPARNADGRITSPNCRDVNPASFHTALAKYLAEGKPFVFDVEPALETWNQPVYGYSMKLGTKQPKPADYKNAAPGTVSVIDVEVDLSYIVEAHPEKIGMTEQQLQKYIRTKKYAYWLELNDKDLVIGGEWKSAGVPDFMWRPDELPTDKILATIPGGYPLSYDKVKELLTSSAGQTPVVQPPTNPVVDNPGNNDPAAPVTNSVATCRSCTLTFAPGGLVGRSNDSIRNLVRRAFSNKGVFSFVRANNIVTSADKVVVPVTFLTKQKTENMKKWLAEAPFNFELKSVSGQ